MSKIVTVTLNPAYDTTVVLDELSSEKINRPVEESRVPAGKGINISETLKTLGCPNVAVAIVGRDSLEAFRRPLFDKGLECRFVVTDGTVRENLTILSGGETYKINRAGEGVDDQADGRVLALLADLFEPGDIAVFSGSAPEGLTGEKLERLIMNTAARGYKIVIDSEAVSADMLMRIKPWLIKPNEFELAKIVGRGFADVMEMLASCNELVSNGVGQVVLSLGEHGLYAITRDETVFAVPPEVEAVSTVGAGDNALAGYIYSMLSGKTLGECAAFAAACGTAAVQSALPYLEDTKEVDGLIEKIKII